VRYGRLERTGQAGVYRVAGSGDSEMVTTWLAVLGTNSPLSYLSAAITWDVPVPNDPWVHITRFDRRRLEWPPGVRVHRVALEPTAVTERDGLRLTTRTETLLDCLGWLPIGDARTLADRAKQQRWLAAADVEQRLRDQPGRWGNRQLRLILESMGDDAHSEAERRLHTLLRRAGFSGWQANLSVYVARRRYVLDVAFQRQRVAIEIDGYRTHSDRDAFQNDRTKDVQLRLAGWTVLRFTWSDLVDRPDDIITTLTTLLAD
jgi:very-short-patch-repair endonuclease